MILSHYREKKVCRKIKFSGKEKSDKLVLIVLWEDEFDDEHMGLTHRINRAQGACGPPP